MLRCLIGKDLGRVEVAPLSVGHEDPGLIIVLLPALKGFGFRVLSHRTK